MAAFFEDFDNEDFCGIQLQHHEFPATFPLLYDNDDKGPNFELSSQEVLSEELSQVFADNDCFSVPDDEVTRISGLSSADNSISPCNMNMTDIVSYQMCEPVTNAETQLPTQSKKTKSTRNFILTSSRRQESLLENFDSIYSEATEHYSTGSRNITHDSRHSCSVGNSNSKNAIAARDNRLKKKKYVASLEETVRSLRSENQNLLEQVLINKKNVSNLENEIAYLKNVIANQSTLSAILKNVMKTPSVRLSTSFESQPRHSRHRNSCSVNSAGTFYQVDMPRALESSGNIELLEEPSTPVNHMLRGRKRKLPGSSNDLINSQISHRTKEAIANREHFIHGVGGSEISDTSPVTVSSYVADACDGGVCLHVSGNNVSFEFCSYCNNKATSKVVSDHSYVKWSSG